MHEESFYAERAIRAGASWYITKHQAADEVLVAIRRVLAREVYFGKQMTSGFLKRLSTTEVMTAPGTVDRLTDRELELLNLIGGGHATRGIADTLQVGIARIDTYRAKIKEKMNLRTAAESAVRHQVDP